MTLLAIVAIHTAANEPPKVRQVMNKIHRNVASLHNQLQSQLHSQLRHHEAKQERSQPLISGCSTDFVAVDQEQARHVNSLG